MAIPLGGLIAVAVLLPNLLVAFRPPTAAPAKPAERGGLFTTTMEALERLGQVGAFVIPFVYPIEVADASAWAALGVMAAMLGLYYACWARFLWRGRAYALLFAPFLGLPLPMAATPIAYFLAAAGLLRSAPLAIAAVVLGVGHLYVSQRERQRCLAVSGGELGSEA